MKTIGKWALVAICAVVAWSTVWSPRDEGDAGGEVGFTGSEAYGTATEESRGGGPAAGVDEVRRAFEERAQSRQMLVEGVVLRTLADDREGSPHQRFIIDVGDGQTLLVAHNLDLAPRLDGLSAGERVRVYGEYEWNPQGGVMHWTHDDPRGNHVTGYVEWRGRRYE